MYHDVKVDLGPTEVLPDIFDWINGQGWKYMLEWRWFKPELHDRRYTFQFDNAKHATMFTLRWA